MNRTKNEGADFIGYEYMELSASGERAAFCLDCYQNFGWVPDERANEVGTKGKIILRRDRKIINKTELTRLQHHFEACVEEIRALERSKSTDAAMAALGVGLVGTVFMALSTFAAVHTPPLWIPSILLAAPGFLGWAAPRFLYKKVAARRTKAVAGLVEQKYDEIYELCEQGNTLLN